MKVPDPSDQMDELKEEEGKPTALSFELTPAAPKLVKKKARKGKGGSATAEEPNADEA